MARGAPPFPGGSDGVVTPRAPTAERVHPCGSLALATGTMHCPDSLQTAGYTHVRALVQVVSHPPTSHV